MIVGKIGHFRRSYKFCKICGKRNIKNKIVLVFSTLENKWWCLNCNKHVEIEWKQVIEKHKISGRVDRT